MTPGRVKRDVMETGQDFELLQEDTDGNHGNHQKYFLFISKCTFHNVLPRLWNEEQKAASSLACDTMQKHFHPSINLA